jgi:hypothetical protein
MAASCAALIPDPNQSSENYRGATVEKVDGLGESARFITEASKDGRIFTMLNVRMQQSDAGMPQSVIHLQLVSTTGEFLPGRKPVMIEAMKLILARIAQGPASSQAESTAETPKTVNLSDGSAAATPTAPGSPVSSRKAPALTQEQAASGQPQRSAETASAQANTPVGHWVAEHPSKGGIGSWWEFRTDGSLTMHAGVVITFPITRSGNTMTRPGGTVNGPPEHFTFQVVGDTLHLFQNVYEMAGVSDMAAFRQKAPDYKGPETIDMAYSRVGAAPSAADPLLGQWKPVPPTTPPNPTTDQSQAALQKMALNSITLFSADGTESLRMPFSSREGTWDASAHTFRYASQAAVYSFERTGAKLTLGQPPNNTQTDTYLPDPFF